MTDETDEECSSGWRDLHRRHNLEKVILPWVLCVAQRVLGQDVNR